MFIEFGKAVSAFNHWMVAFGFEKVEYEKFENDIVNQFIMKGYDYGEHCVTVLVSKGSVTVAVSDSEFDVSGLWVESASDVYEAAKKAHDILADAYAPTIGC